jgi:hypothetical protein
MLRYINYVLTAILVMLILPFAPVLAIAAIPIAFIYYMVEPSEGIWQKFSFRRMIRKIGFAAPKKMLALYIFWLYVHLVCLGAFSSGVFNPSNFAMFWPFAGDIHVYDITEFMVFTGPPLFFILIYGMRLNDVDVVDDEDYAYSESSTQQAFEKLPTIQPTIVEPVRSQPSPVAPLVEETLMEEEIAVVDMATPVMTRSELPDYSPTNSQELLMLLQQQQQRIDLLDAELQSLKAKVQKT